MKIDEIKLSKNLEALKVFGTNYFKRDLFRPPPYVIEDIKYNKNYLQVGRRLDGSIYTLDLTEACRILFLGATRCMPLGTLVRTKNGLVPIELCTEVETVNFDRKRVEDKKCKVHYSGKLRVIKITMFSEHTIECSPEHKFFAMISGQKKLVEAKNLKFKDSLFNIDTRKYERIAKINYSEELKEMVDLEVDENHNFILEDGTVTHNSGKTFFLRSIADRLYQTERDVLFLSDVKNEFYSSINPVQPKFEGDLLEGETPTGMNVVTLRPTFFKTVVPEKHPSNFWYSVDMRELSKADFLTMMNASTLTTTQQVALELIYQQLYKKYEEDENLDFSVDLINEIIDSLEELSSVQKTSLKFKFKPLEMAKFFEVKYKRNIVSLIKKGYVPAINVENFDTFGQGAFLFPEVTLNIVLREVILARRRGDIRPLWVILDEASRFIGTRKSGSLKESILQCLEENTLIKTKSGDKKIKELNENKDLILSYDIDKKKSVWSTFHKFGEKEKDVFEIELENGKKIICSDEHKLFKMGFQNKLEEKKLKDLKLGDRLVCNELCPICGEIILKKKRKYCSIKCASKGYDHSWKFGRKNPHTLETKIKIKESIRKIYDNNVGGIKDKLSKSSKRTYEERIGIESSNKLKKNKSIKMKYARNNDKRFDSNIVKANLGRKLSDEWKKNISKAGVKYWSSLSDDEKCSMIKKTIWSCRGRGKKTNIERDAEKILIKYGFKFLGSGTNGNLNGLFPDFVNFEKKIIIEVFALYWKIYTFGSRINYEKIRKKQFPGWKIYFFDEHEINKIEVIMSEIFKNKIN